MHRHEKPATSQIVSYSSACKVKIEVTQRGFQYHRNYGCITVSLNFVRARATDPTAKTITPQQCCYRSVSYTSLPVASCCKRLDQVPFESRATSRRVCLHAKGAENVVNMKQSEGAPRGARGIAPHVLIAIGELKHGMSGLKSHGRLQLLQRLAIYVVTSFYSLYGWIADSGAL